MCGLLAPTSATHVQEFARAKDLALAAQNATCRLKTLSASCIGIEIPSTLLFESRSLPATVPPRGFTPQGFCPGDHGDTSPTS